MENVCGNIAMKNVSVANVKIVHIIDLIIKRKISNMIKTEIIEKNQKKITDWWNGIISMLPTQSIRDKNGNFGFWTMEKKFFALQKQKWKQYMYS